MSPQADVATDPAQTKAGSAGIAHRVRTELSRGMHDDVAVRHTLLSCPQIPTHPSSHHLGVITYPNQPSPPLDHPPPLDPPDHQPSRHTVTPSAGSAFALLSHLFRVRGM
eukprot:585909-Rhodomonas_salina.1